MRYHPEDLRSVPIADVAITLGLQTRRSGSSTLTHCTSPSHEDRHPSMSLDTRRNRYKCFACGNAGTSVDLVMQVLSFDFPAAADWLGRAFQLAQLSSATPRSTPHPSHASVRPSRPTARPPVPRPSPSPSPSISSTPILETLLSHLAPLSSPGSTYLESRGISSQTAACVRVSFITDPAATDRFLRSAFPLEQLVVAGLHCAPDPSRHKPATFRFFRHRLLFPLLVADRPVFLQGRRLDGDARPKYLSTTGALPAPYNADLLRTLSPGSRVLIAEGPIDTLTLLDRGYPAVGIFGVENFKSAWVPLFRDLDVVLVLDADPAGRKGTARLASLFAAAGKRVRSVALPEGADVNAFFARSPACPP